MTMITAKELLEKVLDIESEQPVYRTGGTGDDGTCDCIGAVMGGMYRLGRAKYPLHSSNYFARYQTEALCEITEPSLLLPGQIVYKSKDDPSDLNSRYLPGGTHCTGDTRDYYHAGMVVSASPLVIVHCTSSGGVNGFTRDERLGGWRWAGRVKGVSYEEADKMNETAVVTVASGTTANLRIRPSRESRRIAKVPAGTTVTAVASTSAFTVAAISCGTVATVFSLTDAEADLAIFTDGHNLYLYHLAYCDKILNFFDIDRSHFRNMYHTCFIFRKLHKYSEIGYSCDFTFNNATYRKTHNTDKLLLILIS